MVWYCVIEIEELIALVKNSRSQRHGRVEILSFAVAAELISSFVTVFAHETEDRPAIDLWTSLAYAIVLCLLRD